MAKEVQHLLFPFPNLSEKGSGIALKSSGNDWSRGFIELVDRLIERKIWWHLIVEPQQLDHVGSLKNRINNRFFPLGVSWLHPKHSLSMRSGPPQKKIGKCSPQEGRLFEDGRLLDVFFGCFCHFPRLPPAHVSQPFCKMFHKNTFHLIGTEPGQLYQMRLFISASPMLRMHFQIACSKGDIQYSIKSQHTLTYVLLCSFLVLDLIFTCKLRCFIQYGLCQASLWIASLALPRTSDSSGWLLAGRFSRSWLLFPPKNA